jgi:oligoendopeptidase F
MAVALRERSEVDQRYTWDLASIYPTLEAWQDDLKRVEEALPGLESFKGHLGDSAQKLLEWFRAYEATLERAGHLLVYSSMLHDSDTTNQEANALKDRARAVFARFGGATAFADPELLAILEESATEPGPSIEQFMSEEPQLGIYRHYFDMLGKREGHVRSPEVEAVLAMASDVMDTGRNAHGILADADLKFGSVQTEEGEAVEVANGTMSALLRNPDIAVRKASWEQYADGFLEYKNTFASCLSGGIKKDAFYARAHNYESSLDAALSLNFIPPAVYENMLQTSQRKLPVWHRYWSARRRALGLDKLHPYDIFAPLTEHEPKIPYAQGVDMICAGMQPLGDDYVQPMRRGLLEERWVDVYPNKGKRSGAYSSGFYGTNPFILMSYNDNLSDVSTLAHELGHSMHSYYSRKTQPIGYSRYSMFVAETASNFNQAMVRAHLLATNDDPQFQIAIIEEAMGNFHRYFFVMPILARFERELHERVERGEALTADGMTSLMAGMFREGYGPEVEIDEPRVGITWAQFPTHMYLNFYVYQYATGISAANALADRVLKQGPQAAEDYKNFLKAGSSVYPLDALKLAGVDMTSPEPVEQAFNVLEGFVERLEKLTRKT